MLFAKVMVSAFYYVFMYRKHLLKALLLPFVAYMAIGLTKGLGVHDLTYYLMMVASIIIHTIVAITTHRMILLGEQSVPEWGLRSWTKRESSFLVHAMVLTALMYAIVLAPAWLPFVPMALVPLALCVVIWLWARFSLVFPAIAINQDSSFQMSWGLTKNHQMLMLAVVVLFPILLALPTLLLTYLPYSSVIANILSIMVTLFEVAALSTAYQLITSKNVINS